MKAIYTRKTWMNLAFAAGLLVAAAPGVLAESFSVDVPFAFAAGGSSFPAGVYNVDSVASGVLIIRGAKSSVSAAVLVSPAAYSDSSKTSLVFERSPEMATLSSVNLTSGLTLTIAPSKRMAGPMAAKGAVVLSHP